jgi:hypothetical protein
MSVAGQHDGPPTVLDGGRASAISNLVVRLMNQYTGRGPTRAVPTSRVTSSPYFCGTR